jgi:hypothetical protein
MTSSDEHRDKIRGILAQMRAHRVPVGGGSGRRERYEMRQTDLYFSLGQELLAMMSSLNLSELNRCAFLTRIGVMVEQEFDFNPGIVKMSVRFVSAFNNMSYFEEVSRLCKDSYGQLREVVDILSKENPLGLSDNDLREFKRNLARDLTYDDMRTLCVRLRQKYRGIGEDAQVDYEDLADTFDDVNSKAQNLIQTENQADREKFRQLVGPDTIKNLRYSLILLAKEAELEKNKLQVRRILSVRRDGSLIMEASVAKLLESLIPFLGFESKTRERLRKFLSPVDMSYLQKELKALESEEEYRKYKQTEEVFASIVI